MEFAYLPCPGLTAVLWMDCVCLSAWSKFWAYLLTYLPEWLADWLVNWLVCKEEQSGFGFGEDWKLVAGRSEAGRQKTFPCPERLPKSGLGA